MNFTLSSQQNSTLFKELDKHSNGLRAAAGDLLDILNMIENKPKEIITLGETLKKLQKTVIENMDDVILELNKNAQLATLKLNEISLKYPASLKLDQSILLKFIEKSDVLSSEVMQLTQKACELNKKGR